MINRKKAATAFIGLWLCLWGLLYVATRPLLQVFSESVPVFAAATSEVSAPLPATVDVSPDLAPEQIPQVKAVLSTISVISEKFQIHVRPFTQDGAMPAYSDLATDTIYLSPSITPDQIEHILLHEVGHLVDKNFMNDDLRAAFCTVKTLDCNLWHEGTYGYGSVQTLRGSWLASPAEAFAEGFALYIENRSPALLTGTNAAREKAFFRDLLTD